MDYNQTAPKPTDAEQKSGKWFDETSCSPVFSDTPETDKVSERLGYIWERFKLAVHSAPIAYASEPTIVPSDFARQLERERDEALATLRDVLVALVAMDHEGPRLAALRVKGERDEAIKALASINSILNERDQSGRDLEIGSPAFKSCIRWSSTYHTP